MQAELAWYLELAKSDYPDEYQTCVSCYGDTPAARSAAAECAYIKMHNALPAWGYVVERFEVVNGNYLFVHRDLDATL